MKPFALAVLALPALFGPVFGQEAAPAVSLELSRADASGGACTLSFVAQNAHASDISSAVYETVLFDAEGRVAKLTLLDFQDLPSGRMRVRQFHFADLPCSGISRILINGASTCEGDGLPPAACGAPSLASREKMELLG
jgi:hypothetical protein